MMVSQKHINAQLRQALHNSTSEYTSPLIDNPAKEELILQDWIERQRRSNGVWFWGLSSFGYEAAHVYGLLNTHEKWADSLSLSAPAYQSELFSVTFNSRFVL